MPLSERKIVLAVSGGIAAFKAAELASRLMKSGARVRVAMTPAATNFIAPLTFEAIVGRPIYGRVFDQPDSHRMEHIEWARWAEAVVVAPASTNFIARYAAGLADDAPTTLLLAFDGPVWLAPAMNTKMWEHAATQANIQTLRSRGVRVLGPGAGPLACGEIGEGRMIEPAEIVAALEAHFAGAPAAEPARRSSKSEGGSATPAPSEPHPLLAGRRVLITAGPTRESLDPIRYISNRSSGRMGVELAAAAMRLGAKVTLVHGPMSAAPPPGAEALAVEDAESMLAAVVERLPGCAVAIFAAAVANYRMAVRSPEKIKGGERINLELMRTPDIAAWAGAHRDAKDPALLVGFAAESRDLIAAARKKLKDKRLDFIFANAIGKPGQGFDAESNAVALVAPEGKPVESGVMPKRELAEWIWERLIERMPDSKGSSR